MDTSTTISYDTISPSPSSCDQTNQHCMTAAATEAAAWMGAACCIHSLTTLNMFKQSCLSSAGVQAASLADEAISGILFFSNSDTSMTSFSNSLEIVWRKVFVHLPAQLAHRVGNQNCLEDSRNLP